MIELSIEVSSKPITDVLTRLQRGMRNLEPVMDEIGGILEARVSGRFESERDPEGDAWAPWAPSTAESYPDDANGRILDRYGDMLNSLNHQADSSSVRVGFSAAASDAGDVYAIYHEYGTETMPRRGLLTANPESGELAEDDEEAVLDVLNEWLEGLAK